MSRDGPGASKRAFAERMNKICLVDGVFMMNARHLPGAVVTPGQRRAGSPGHAQSDRSARRLARRGHGMDITPLVHRGHGMNTTIPTLAHRRQSRGARRLALVALVSGAWRVVVFPLALVAEGSRLAPVAGDRVARAWGAAI